VIEIVLDAADIVMTVMTAGSLSVLAYATHQHLIGNERDRANSFQIRLKKLQVKLLESHQRATRAEHDSKLVNSLKSQNTLLEFENQRLVKQNSSLEYEVQDYAQIVGETLGSIDDIFPTDENDLPDNEQARFNEENFPRMILERISLASVYDCLYYARGPLVPFAKAFGIGAFEGNSKPFNKIATITEYLEIMEELVKENRIISAIEINNIEKRIAAAHPKNESIPEKPPILEIDEKDRSAWLEERREKIKRDWQALKETTITDLHNEPARSKQPKGAA